MGTRSIASQVLCGVGVAALSFALAGPAAADELLAHDGHTWRPLG